jgi:type I restriction enzyme M protein
VRTKQKLLNDFDLYCIVSLPGGVFTTAGAGVKTNLLFFNKGSRTEKIWYYDLSHIKVGKKTPLTLAHFEEFFRLLPDRADSENSWTVDVRERMKIAGEEAEPFHMAADAAQAALFELIDEWKAAKKEHGKTSPEALEALEEANMAKREWHRNLGKAKDIEDGVFDLKAVNPKRRPVIDTRTPEELIALIREKNAEIEAAMCALEATLSDASPLT